MNLHGWALVVFEAVFGTGLAVVGAFVLFVVGLEIRLWLETGLGPPKLTRSRKAPAARGPPIAMEDQVAEDPTIVVISSALSGSHRIMEVMPSLTIHNAIRLQIKDPYETDMDITIGHHQAERLCDALRDIIISSALSKAS